MVEPQTRQHWRRVGTRVAMHRFLGNRRAPCLGQNICLSNIYNFRIQSLARLELPRSRPITSSTRHLPRSASSRREPLSTGGQPPCSEYSHDSRWHQRSNFRTTRHLLPTSGNGVIHFAGVFGHV
jgi:hypothetical protein